MRDGLAWHDDGRGRRRRSCSSRKRGASATSRLTSLTVEKAGSKPALETSPSKAGPTRPRRLGGLATADPLRGYREELEQFASGVRHGTLELQ